MSASDASLTDGRREQTYMSKKARGRGVAGAGSSERLVDMVVGSGAVRSEVGERKEGEEEDRVSVEFHELAAAYILY